MSGVGKLALITSKLLDYAGEAKLPKEIASDTNILAMGLGDLGGYYRRNRREHDEEIRVIDTGEGTYRLWNLANEFNPSQTIIEAQEVPSGGGVINVALYSGGARVALVIITVLQDADGREEVAAILSDASDAMPIMTRRKVMLDIVNSVVEGALLDTMVSRAANPECPSWVLVALEALLSSQQEGALKSSQHYLDRINAAYERRLDLRRRFDDRLIFEPIERGY